MLRLAAKAPRLRPPLMSNVRRHMPALRDFELEAIRLMAGGELSEQQLRILEDLESAERYEYTGSGYYLTLRHVSLPAAERTLSTPAVVGEAGDVRCGFVAFLGNSELVLECHTWGEVDVPDNFRELDVSISTPPITSIGRFHDA